MPFDHELTHLYAPPYDAPRQVAHLFLAFDLAAFGDPEAFPPASPAPRPGSREETGAAEG